jgi:hypothetical protein
VGDEGSIEKGREEKGEREVREKKGFSSVYKHYSGGLSHR